MPYLILALGILLGLFSLYRFFINATLEQIHRAFYIALASVIGLLLLYLALSGRLGISLALLFALLPFVIVWFHKKLRQKRQKTDKNIHE